MSDLVRKVLLAIAAVVVLAVGVAACRDSGSPSSGYGGGETPVYAPAGDDPSNGGGYGGGSGSGGGSSEPVTPATGVYTPGNGNSPYAGP
jgi:hypothetical protein